MDAPAVRKSPTCFRLQSKRHLLGKEVDACTPRPRRPHRNPAKHSEISQPCATPCRHRVFYFQPAKKAQATSFPTAKTPGGENDGREGVMKSPKPDAVFGLHVWAGIPAGKIAYRPAPPSPAPMTCASKSSADKPTPAAHGTASTRSPSVHKPSSACKPWSAAAPIFRLIRR